jgi:hypothetical protein
MAYVERRRERVNWCLTCGFTETSGLGTVSQVTPALVSSGPYSAPTIMDSTTESD